MSIGLLYDDDCVALFGKRDLYVFKNNALVLKGLRNTVDGLWDVPIPQNITTQNSSNRTTQQINVILHKNQSHHQLATFYHGALYSPRIKTLKQANNNDQLLSWPAINKLNFGKYIVDTKAIHMGHLEQECQYLQFTKRPSTQQPSRKTLETINTIIPFDAKSMVYGDLT